MKKIQIIGNSQFVTSIAKAYLEQLELQKIGEEWANMLISKGVFKYKNININYLSCNMSLHGPISINELGQVTYEQGMENLKDLIDADTLIVMLRGNEFAFQSIVNHPPYDFTYKTDFASLGNQYVHLQDVLKNFDEALSPLYATLVFLRHFHSKTRIYYVAPPCAIENEESIISNPEVFGELIGQYGLRKFRIRKKIYDLMYANFAEKIKSLNIETIMNPSECLTANGGFKAEYAHGCLHGNELYGRALMIEFERRGILNASL